MKEKLLANKAPLFCGYINNPNIEQIVIETKEIQAETTIIDQKIWYVALDEPQNPPVTITAYDKIGNIIYQK